MGLISSLGKRPSRLHCSMMGMRFSSMNLRVLSRTSRSSSLSSVSNSMKSTPLNLIAISILTREENCWSHRPTIQAPDMARLACLQEDFCGWDKHLRLSGGHRGVKPGRGGRTFL